jgi:hypothetical protein
MMTPSNNIRWNKVIKKGKRKEFKFVATIEYPSDRGVDLGSAVTTSRPAPVPSHLASVNPIFESPSYSVQKSFRAERYQTEAMVCDDDLL